MKLLRSACANASGKRGIMPEDYERGKCAALVKEAREITDHLKAEAESIRRQECSKAERMNH
jgi:hypothetical protein